VPLSEHEQRVLEQIERSLYADDPKFAATVRGIDPRTQQRRRYVRSIVGAVIGLAMLPVGIAVGHIEIAFAGFLLTFLAVLYGVTSWRRGAERPDAKTPVAPLMSRGARTGSGRRAAGRAAAPKRGLMQRFEDRWNKRREGNGYGS
jgi:hypothetical protein